MISYLASALLFVTHLVGPFLLRLSLLSNHEHATKTNGHDNTIRCPNGKLCYYTSTCNTQSPPSSSPPLAPASTAIIATNPQSSPRSLQQWKPTYPTAAPWTEDDTRYTWYCGKNWGHASETCQVWCPDADDDKCPYGEYFL